ncbi:DsbA family oxidoreductase [Nocardioides sp.]|uniref:DsbA family oxidoreductase n=1 Tax=Nocardioides sp. TaxID=35761 RepID=UPI003566E5E7
MLVEIWSDVVCPWCFIGKRRFESALKEFAHRDEVEVIYRSFELDPSAPEVGVESISAALGRKYGGTPEQVTEMMGTVSALAAAEGLRFDYENVTHTNTIDAHRLLHLALDVGGLDLQAKLKEALLSAYFEAGRSMGDREVLTDVAVSAGLDPARVAEVLDSEEYADGVGGDLRQAFEFGIQGVPFYVFDRQLAVSGAQAPEAFAQALDQAYSAETPTLGVLADGTVCGPDGCALEDQSA